MALIPDNCIRKTRSICSKCRRNVEAWLLEKNGRIVMQKHCPEHGTEDIFVSRHPWYYRELTEYYFSVMPRIMKQKRYYIYLSNKCNLNCPICLLSPNRGRVPDISLKEFRKVIESKRDCRFYLYGAEPTLRGDLKEWITLLKRNGNTVNIHTNGLKLADYDYVCELKNWGADYISMQFDGFDDAVYQTLRGRKMLDEKLKALENLKQVRIATGFNVTIAKEVNENQIEPILDYALNNNFVKDVSFATLSSLGDAQDNFVKGTLLMPDELIDIVESETNGRISRENIFLSQKLYYTVLSLLNLRRCYNFQHLVLFREKYGEYTTLDNLFKLEGFSPVFEGYKKLVKKNRIAAGLYFSIRFALNFLGRGFLKRLKSVPFSLLAPKGIVNVRIPDKTLLVSIGTVCDPLKYDAGISRYCGQGFCLEQDGEIVLTDTISDVSIFQGERQINESSIC